MKELKYKSIVLGKDGGYHILLICFEKYFKTNRVYLSKEQITDLIIKHVKWLKCPNCGECFVKRNRQHSPHCSKCTMLSSKRIDVLSPDEQLRRKEIERKKKRTYRNKLKAKQERV